MMFHNIESQADMEVNLTLLKRMMDNRPRIPEGVSGDGEVAVKHAVVLSGQPLTVVSLRNALLMGQEPLQVRFEDSLLIRELTYEGGVWMRDDPQEVWQMAAPVESVYGRVLVGGLGLGTISHLIAHSGDVDEVVTVEKDHRIIDLVADHIDSEVVQADVFDFVKEVKKYDFDSAYIDVWQSTGEMIWVNYVVPLRRFIRGKIDNSDVHCWNEEEVWGQLRMSLCRSVDIDLSAKNDQFTGYREVFRRACVEAGIKPPKPAVREGDDPMASLDQEGWFANMQDKNLIRILTLYLEATGTEAWEARFGRLWDELVEEPKFRKKSEVAQ